MAHWNREHVVNLIRLYQTHPILYDMKHNDYYNRVKREKVLTEMCAEIRKVRPKTCVQEIKQKIKTIRTQYTAEKLQMSRTKRKGIGIDEVCEPKLWCFEMMNFLDNYTKDRQEGVQEIVAAKLENIVTVPTAVTFSDDHSITIEDVPYNLENNGFVTESEASQTQGSDKYEVVNPMKKMKKDKKFVTKACSALQFAKDFTLKPHEETKEEIFGRFITMELKQITDIQVYNETKWKIQTALMEGLTKQLEIDKS